MLHTGKYLADILRFSLLAAEEPVPESDLTFFFRTLLERIQEQAVPSMPSMADTLDALKDIHWLLAAVICLLGASPIRAELLENADLCFVRELTGGLYFGEKSRDGDTARDVCTYTVSEVERVVRLAGRLARGRRGRLTSVDKANVLETSRLWRETTERVMRDEFPDVELEHALVDAASMQILQQPRHFDVIVTENLFGDILTDEASVLAGSIGVLPSASLSQSGAGLYEPIHGSAPDLAGRNVANPVGSILSAAMLLRHSLGMAREADALEAAVHRTLSAGIATADLCGDGGSPVSTTEMTACVIERLLHRHSRAVVG